MTEKEYFEGNTCDHCQKEGARDIQEWQMVLCERCEAKLREIEKEVMS